MMNISINISGFGWKFTRIASLCLVWTALTVGGRALGQEANEPAPQDEPKSTPKVQKANDSESEPVKPTAKTHPFDPMIWDVDQMMDDAVDQISLRYNLNKSQKEYTRLLLTTRVRSFLDDYEGEIRQLLQESIEYRQGMASSDPESLKQWADRAGPIYEAAQQAILDGNMTWREILTEEQKNTHDRDLGLMKRNFKSVSSRLTAWQEGQGKLGPGEPIAGGGRQPGTEAGRVSPDPRQKNAELEDNWTHYVNEFIRVYKLDEKQQNSAREKIHKFHLNEAKRYRTKKQDELEALDTKLKSGESRVDRQKLVHQKIKLLQPIYQMFTKMAQRLDDLRTTEQKVNVDAKEKEGLDKLYKQFSGEGMTKLLKARTGKSAVKADKPSDDDNKEEDAAKEASKEKSPEKADAEESEKAKPRVPPKADDSDGKPEKDAESPKKEPAEESDG